MKKSLRWALLCGTMGWTPATWAQDSAPTENKAAAREDKGDGTKSSKEDGAVPERDQSEKAGKVEIGRAQREVQAAQRALEKAQAEAKRAQAEVVRAQGQAQRAQAEAQRYYPGTFRYTVVRDGDSRQVRAFRLPGGFVQAFGLDFVSADPILKAQLGLSASEGLVVSSVAAGGSAEKAGIQKNDVIAKLDGKPVHIIPEAQQIIADRGKPAVVVNLIRAGKPVEVTWTKPEPPASKEPFYIGVYLASVDATLRSQLPALPEGTGMVVTEVTPDSPAAKADVKKYDIAIKVDDKPIKENSDLSEQVQKTGAEPIKLTLVRGGEAKVLSITPVRRPTTPKFTVDATVNSSDLFRVLKGEHGDADRIFFNWTPNGDKTLNLPNLGAYDQAKLRTEIRDQLQTQVKELDKQMEGLRKAIEAMGQNITDSKSDAKDKKKD